MNGENKHTVRLVFVLALMVVALLTVSIDAFKMDDDQALQAAVLRVYAQ